MGKIADEMIEEINKTTNIYTYISRLEKENESLDTDREKLWKHNANLQKKIDDILQENFKLKGELEEAEDTLAELRNLCTKQQLSELEFIIKRKGE